MPEKDSDIKNSNVTDLEENQNEFECEFNTENMPRHDKKMIRGFMRGFGKAIILWLISKKRQHGYEIMTQLHASSPLNGKMPSASMIYPVLHDLEKNGLIKGAWEHHGKRKVKYYEITVKGEESLNRIRQIAARGREIGAINLWKEFMQDMFALERK
ncbi:MAG TPA: PadR family transcriptional regulator [Methanobacteriaceae archaeon]|nr:PadR family transcriptional regulator [Methanobacteriaceae archaeon]